MTSKADDVEYKFSPSTSSEHSDDVTMSTPPPMSSEEDDDEDDTEVEALEWEESFVNPGSDVDSEDEEIQRKIHSPTEPHKSKDGLSTPDFSDNEETILSVIDAQDDSVLQQIANDEMCVFNWSSDLETFRGQREEFTGQVGPTFDVSNMSPFAILRKVWDDDIITLIVEETNRYGKEISNKRGKITWVDITVKDMWIYLAVVMLQSIVHVPIEKEYWYPCMPFLKIGNFNNIMPFKRFTAIKRCLHFVNNKELKGIPSSSLKLAKIKPIIDHLNDKFSSLYLPEQNISIYESLLEWQGRLSFAQMIKTKAAQVGIKCYELCESSSGYLWKMLVYTGKNEKGPDKKTDNSGGTEGATSKIVYSLVRPLLNKGHTLVLDSSYNSPLLSRTLKAKKTDTMGTLRLNKKFVPEGLRNLNKSNTRLGEILTSQTDDLSICVWHETNMVAMISTYHKTKIVGKDNNGVYRYKPQVALDYNLAMGGVDKKEQMLQAFPLERIKNQVWYKKLFRRLLNISIYNCFVLYKTKHTKYNQRKFRVELVNEIIETILRPPPLPVADPNAVGHYPVKNETGRSRCKWCTKHKKSSRTAFKCEGCNVNLCISANVSCFKEYHIFLRVTSGSAM